MRLTLYCTSIKHQLVLFSRILLVSMEHAGTYLVLISQQKLSVVLLPVNKWICLLKGGVLLSCTIGTTTTTTAFSLATYFLASTTNEWNREKAEREKRSTKEEKGEKKKEQGYLQKVFPTLRLLGKLAAVFHLFVSYVLVHCTVHCISMFCICASHLLLYLISWVYFFECINFELVYVMIFMDVVFCVDTCLIFLSIITNKQLSNA